MLLKLICFCLNLFYDVNRYSLAMHHNEDELRKFGLTDDMLADQEW